MKKVLLTILGIGTALLGFTMMIFAWYFFFEEEETILCLASLYVCLFISAIIVALGISLTQRKRE